MADKKLPKLRRYDRRVHIHIQDPNEQAMGGFKSLIFKEKTDEEIEQILDKHCPNWKFLADKTRI